MKQYLAVYTGTPAGLAQWNALSDEERRQREQAGTQAWGAWAQAHRDAIVHVGSPLGRTKVASRTGIADTRNNLSAWTLVQAESHDAAVRLFAEHPHFTVFPGDAVEVMECLPLPV